MWSLFTRRASRTGAPSPAIGDPARIASRLGTAGVPRHHEIAAIEMIGQVAVVTLTVEELSQQRGAEQLADLLEVLVDAGAGHMVLDIQNVVFMDSACIGCMVEALNRLSRCGGRIALANPASSVAGLFRLTRLDRVFPICADVLSAIDAVERGLRETTR